MRKKLFQCAVLWHPTEKQSKEEGKSTIVIVKPYDVLATDDKAAGMNVVMSIPAEYKDQLDQIEVIVRPF